MTRLFLAVDDLSQHEQATHNLLRELADTDLDFDIKVNLDYALKKALSSLASLKVYGRNLFADLKMWNGKRTMAETVDQLADLGIGYVNVYALADSEIGAAVEASRGRVKVLGITVLSHYDDAYCLRHFRRPLADAVQHLTLTAIAEGCDGVILPGTTLNAVRHISTIKIATGVRPKWYKDTRHRQEVTPAQAKAGGADWVVCGSPITESDDPAWSLQRTLVAL